MLSAVAGRVVAGALLTVAAAMLQAFFAARYNFRGPLHPLLLVICPAVAAFLVQISPIGRLGVFLALLLLSLAAFALTAEWLGTFS